MIVVRRLPMVVVTVAAFAAVGVLARDTTSPVDAVFSDVSAPWMPAAPLAGGLTSTWFCPGVPASGADRTAGHVTVFNAEDHAVEARATFLVDGDRADAVLTKAYEVPAFGSTDIDVDALVDSQFAAVVVEIDGGGGLVEQRAVGPVGTSTAESVTACANSPSSHWYLATGATADDDNEDLVLSNPYDEAAIVDVTLRTSAGTRTPDRFQNFTIPRQSVRVISLEDAAGPDEVNLGVSVVASRGNFVLGRSQTYASDTQSGYVMSLASPMQQTQWWFAYGEKGDDVAESYSLYNPGDEDVDVDLLPLGFLPGADFAGVSTVPVPAGQTVTFDPDSVPGVPDGPRYMVVSTPDGTPIVVERVITHTINGVNTTSVSLGATPRPADGYVADTWYVGLGPREPTDGALAVLNIDAAPAVVTVQAVTTGGLVTVPGLEAVDVDGSSVGYLDLSDPAYLGHELIVRSTTQIFVERVLRRTEGAQGRVATFAVPVNAPAGD